VKKLPWASLLILLFTYGVFGWLIYGEAYGLAHATSQPVLSLRLFKNYWSLWLMGAIYAVLIALSLIAPFKLIKGFYDTILKSDIKSFFAVVIGAFLVVVILNWIEVTARVMLLFSAGALARLDLQTRSYSQWQAFGILVIFSLIGFAIGVIGNELI
jgi:hypothetical protein